MHCLHCEDLARRVAELEDAMAEMAEDHQDLVEEVAEQGNFLEGFLEVIEEEDE